MLINFSLNCALVAGSIQPVTQNAEKSRDKICRLAAQPLGPARAETIQAISKAQEG